MKQFMDEDFLLETETAIRLFHESAKGMPIVDFHNHLSPQEIAEDVRYGNLTEVWLKRDHYKWRAMRANGVPESLVTGEGEDYEKFLAWADTIENCIGNPLYHWTHLELQRYFGVTTPLSKETAKEIWDTCNAKLTEPEFSARGLLQMQNAEVLCTTDDPADDLKYHKALKEEGFEILVLPSFRPEKAIGIEKEGFAEYIGTLSAAVGMTIGDLKELIAVLVKRLDYFAETGCRVSDHSIENTFFIPCTEKEADAIFKKRMRNDTVTEEEAGKYHGYLLKTLGKEYAKRDMVMQLHIGALRNNATRFYNSIGPDAGFDGANDMNYASQLSGLLDAMDETGELPRVILYCLNSRDVDMLSVMAGNFNANDEGIRGKVQPGTAWWFLDHKDGMEHQMKSMANVSLLSASVGMLTDSRSFLSFPRHEYYRRILCNLVGKWVENGEYPDNRAYLDKLVRGICHDNAITYFGFRK